MELIYDCVQRQDFVLVVSNFESCYRRLNLSVISIVNSK
jgi:hypothetical protein